MLGLLSVMAIFGALMGIFIDPHGIGWLITIASVIGFLIILKRDSP